MGKADLTGERFGRLVVVEKAGVTKGRHILWRCKCDCGNESIVQSTALKNGHTQSCGCLKSDDITGNRYGKLVAIKPVGTNARKKRIYLCQCDCGNTRIVEAIKLRSGQASSCGCNSAKYAERATMHGYSGTRLYDMWCRMKARCFNPNIDEYQYYGGRGITICDEWLDFENFREWALANGYDETAPRGQFTIDRENVNGNYEPSNCRWANMVTQNRNRRDRKLYEINGESKYLSDWCREYNICMTTVVGRIGRGWSVESAITTPVGTRRTT